MKAYIKPCLNIEMVMPNSMIASGSDCYYCTGPAGSTAGPLEGPYTPNAGESVPAGVKIEWECSSDYETTSCLS